MLLDTLGHYRLKLELWPPVAGKPVARPERWRLAHQHAQELWPNQTASGWQELVFGQNRPLALALLSEAELRAWLIADLDYLYVWLHWLEQYYLANHGLRRFKLVYREAPLLIIADEAAGSAESTAQPALLQRWRRMRTYYLEACQAVGQNRAPQWLTDPVLQQLWPKLSAPWRIELELLPAELYICGLATNGRDWRLEPASEDQIEEYQVQLGNLSQDYRRQFSSELRSESTNLDQA